MQYKVWKHMKDSEQEHFTSYDFVDAFGIKREQANQALLMLRRKNMVRIVGRAEPRYKPGPALIVYKLADTEAKMLEPTILHL